jgi:predicted metalloprotease
VQAARGRVSETEHNRLSVRLELQADFFAGVWAHFADRAKHVVHGTSEQRVRWFRKGYETGDLRQGDTFTAPNL